ncbi:TPA: hypothetical protein ACGW48_004551 [Bacillus paranthracis]
MNEFVMKLKEMNPKAWEQFESCTSDFHKIENLSVEQMSPWGYEERVTIEEGELPLDYTVFLTLVYLKEYNYLHQPIEKVEWVIPFKFQGCSFSFSREKFGIRLRTETLNEEVAKQMLKRLNSAIKIMERLVSPIIEGLVKKGMFTLQNRFSILRERYLFFREKATASFGGAEQKLTEVKTPVDIEKTISGIFNHRIQTQKEGFFYTQAMLDAYFSFLEHFLVLLLPFSDFNKETDDVSIFIGYDWTKKYNRIFKPDKNRSMAKHYDELQSIKERFRNTYSHGGFEKQYASLFVQVGRLGSIPIQMSGFRESVNFSFLPVKEPDFQEIAKVLDDFESCLKESNEWSKPMLVLDSGSDIHFDDKSIERYKKTMESDTELEAFFEYEAYMYEKYANMDW